MTAVRLGIFYGTAYYLRFYESAFAELARRGHRLVFASEEGGKAGRLPASLNGLRNVEQTTYSSSRADGLESTARIVRFARDFSRFFTPELASAGANRRRALERLLRAVGAAPDAIDPSSLAERLDPAVLETLAGVFRDLEALIPADEQLRLLLERNRLDAAIEVSRVSLGGRQSELVKAAAAAGIPSGIVVYSWDNLTNKGLLAVPPDRLFVWNDLQVEDAVSLHGVPRERVVAAGAPRFDAFFERSPSAGREALLRSFGLDPDRRTLLYLGSSSFVAPREPEFVDAWLAALRDDHDLAGANVLLRPHPATLKATGPWAGWRPPEGSRVALSAGDRINREQDLYDELDASDAVIGLNTSAEIEAAILDKPVLTVRAGLELAPGQEGSVHFAHLLASHGGFVEVADTLAEHLEQLRQTLATDPRAAERRRFVETFVRPAGVAVPAGPVLADAIEALVTPRARRSLRRAVATRGR